MYSFATGILDGGSPALMGSFGLGGLLPQWLSGAWAIVLMIVGFSAVIFVHELGHFVMAKVAGVRVDKFAIGFGKELFGYTYGETRYAFNILPIGGYVKMLGQEDFEIDKSGEWKVKDDPRAFTNKPVGSRMAIVSAGVIMNLVFAALAFMVVFMVGMEMIPPRVGPIEPGSPAHRAGLMPGDEILEIDGSTMDEFLDVKRAIMLADADRPIKMTIRREGLPDPIDIYMEPEWSEEDNLRQVGIYPPMTLEVGGIELASEADGAREDRLKVGDVLVEVDGVKVKDHTEVQRLITDKRGQEVKLLVNRPEDPNQLDSPMHPVTVYHRAHMLVISASDGLGGRHILGLHPRTVLLQVEPKGPAGLAGIRAGDVLVKWGDQWNPTADECRKMLAATDEDGRYIHEGMDLEVIVRRIGMNKEIGVDPDHPTGTVLSYKLVEPLLEQRDALVVLARTDPEATRKRVLEILGKQTKDKLVLGEVGKDLERAAAKPRGLIKWLTDLDRESFLIRPKSGSFWKRSPPQVRVAFGNSETDRLVVSKVVGKDREGDPTPAASLNLPRGALITHVNDAPVKTWIELVEVFRTRAGSEITVTYTHEGVVAKGKMKVPQSLKTALDLQPDASVLAIAGEKRAKFKKDGKSIPVSLPYWGAAYEILKANRGRTVPVVYRYAGKEVTTDAEGKPLTYTVTEDNFDPWLMRIIYAPMLFHFPERFTLQKRNPFAAMWMGFKKTGSFILQAYKMLEHLIITQKVGVEHVSGPVGILRIGHTVAQAGAIHLLYFLAFISANLAVINFLPLPIVDGGLFVFLLLEKIRGRPVSLKTQVVTQIIGLVLLIGIFVFVTFLDVTKWVGEG